MTENKLSLELHELLDRYELLYPDNENLADLRRSVIDHDMSSIFRLLSGEVSGDIEDLRKAVIEQNLHSIFRLIAEDADVEELRKAVIEQNLHSIFRLVEYDDLRKLILEDNIWKLWPILERYIDTQFTAAFKSFFVNGIEIDKDCFSRGQLQSKQWLIEELKKCDVPLGTVYLCAGWYATLATMLFESGMAVDRIRSFDIDTSTLDIAKIFNKPWVIEDWQFQASIADIHKINYISNEYAVKRADGSSCMLNDSPATIINTSCEHIENFKKWYSKIPRGKLVILQSNNYHEIPEHINTSDNLKEFGKSAPMKKTLYLGELELEKYTRFMKIGFR